MNEVIENQTLQYNAVLSYRNKINPMEANSIIIDMFDTLKKYSVDSVDTEFTTTFSVESVSGSQMLMVVV